MAVLRFRGEDYEGMFESDQRFVGLERITQRIGLKNGITFEFDPPELKGSVRETDQPLRVRPRVVRMIDEATRETIYGTEDEVAVSF